MINNNNNNNIKEEKYICIKIEKNLIRNNATMAQKRQLLRKKGSKKIKEMIIREKIERQQKQNAIQKKYTAVHYLEMHNAYCDADENSLY